jgi:site-specific recombinase XerD
MSKPYQWKSPFHFRDRLPDYPEVKRMGEWPEGNREFFYRFLVWLWQGGYQRGTVGSYGAVGRMALGLLNKPHRQLEEADLERVRHFILTRPVKAARTGAYRNGLDKFAQYLRVSRGLPAWDTNRCAVLQVNWAYYLKSLPEWLADDVKVYVAHCRKNWKPSEQHQRSQETASKVTMVLRWMATRATLNSLGDLTPNLWEDYVAARVEADIALTTINHDLYYLQSFLGFLAQAGQPVCERMLRVKIMPKNQPLPRDVPPEQLKRLLQTVEQETHSPHPTTRSLALMDRAWILLMLHSGLRTGEVRQMRLGDIDWERRLLRIEQSKGLKDRLVPLSAVTLEALQAYLAERSRPLAAESPENRPVFIHWQRGLNAQYCLARLKWYGARCGVKASPHQLRHSCATLLLNAGAPVMTVKMILGHVKIDTTLGYARLYDGTVAADYYAAMLQVEKHLNGPENANSAPPSPAELVALVDSLRGGTLNEAQVEKLHLLRAGILALAESGGTMELVKSDAERL